MKTTMRFEGGAELAQKLNSLSMKLSKRVIRDALERSGEPIRAGMQRSAPRAPGAPDIADNIVIGTAKMDGLIDNDHAAAIAIGPAKGFRYGYFIEHGTIHTRAQPFVRPAFDAGWQKALDSIRASFWTALASVGVSRSVSAPVSVADEGDVL